MFVEHPLASPGSANKTDKVLIIRFFDFLYDYGSIYAKKELSHFRQDQKNGK